MLLERIRAEKQQMVKDGKLKAKDIKNDTVIFLGDDNLHYEKFPDGTVKCIEDEIPFELPEGWEWTRLQAICEPITDGPHKTPTYSDEGFIFLSSKNVTSGHIDWDNIMYIPESLHNELYARLAPQKNDILLAKNGTTGVAAIVDRDCIFDIYVSLALLRIIGYIISPEYLLSTIASSTIQNYFNSSLKGIGVPNLHLEHIRTTLIPVAPINEQYRIATKLEQLLSFADNIESDKTDLQTTIQLTKSKILDLAIRGKLVPQNPDDEPANVLLDRIRAEKEGLIKQGKIKRDKKESVIFKGDDNSYYQDLPETWELVNFKDCATLISGRDLNKNEYNAESIGIPYITGASNFINENILIIRWTTVPKIVSEVNDILITCKGTVGELAINKYGNIHIARQIMAIRIYKNINLEYIKFFLESIVMEIKKTANGLIPGISRDDILSLNIPLPPLAEQKRIVDEIEKIFATLDDIANQVA